MPPWFLLGIDHSRGGVGNRGKLLDLSIQVKDPVGLVQFCSTALEGFVGKVIGFQYPGKLDFFESPIQDILSQSRQDGYSQSPALVFRYHVRTEDSGVLNGFAIPQQFQESKWE